ncbi:hypothetical protein [Streptomyces variabilis]
MDLFHDVTGRTVRVGDTIGGTTSGRSQATITGPVIKIGKGKVKVDVRTTTHRFMVSVGEEKWISQDRVFLVAVRAEDLPATGEWTPEDDATVRARATEAMPTRTTDPLTAALLTRLTHLTALADTYRADAKKLTALDWPLERAWRKGYAPDMDEVAGVFGWTP